MKPLLALFIILFIGLHVQAQSDLIVADNEVLIYEKFVDGQKVFIYRHGDEIITYALGDGECGKLSLDGKYIAVSSETPTILRVIDFPKGTVFFEMLWSENWYPCAINWENNNQTLSIRKNSDDSDYYYFQISGLNLIELQNYEYSSPEYPVLPNRLPNTLDNFILPSPNPNIFLYERCLSGRNNPEVETICSEPTEMVIYDIVSETVIELLQVNNDYLRGYTPNEFKGIKLDVVSNELVSWSLNGHYLAFCACHFDFKLVAEGDVKIYDLENDEYITSIRINNPNIWHNLEWSDENILAIWKSGGFNDEYPLEQHGYINHFAFLHVEDEISVLSQDVFYAWQANRLQDSIFAPDSRAIAIVGYVLPPLSHVPDLDIPRIGNLIFIDTLTGESIIIDENVTEIITWREADE